MVIYSLLESLNKALYEGVKWTNIDKKLRLSIASIISKNRDTEAEFIKPKSTATKYDLLPRYVAALLIMHKDCPLTETDIDTIKTFKFVGHKIIELGGTLKEIQDLYVENGGVLKTGDVVQDIQNTNQEIKEDPDFQIQQTENITKEDKEEIQEIIEDIPPGIKSYKDILNFVESEYSNMESILAELATILESTNFEIYKAFYKTQVKDYLIYFTKVYYDENITIHNNGARNVLIQIMYFSKKKYKNLYTYTWRLYVEPETNKILSYKVGDNLVIGNSTASITIPYDELYKVCQTALAKMLYVIQGEFYDPAKIKKDRKNRYKTPVTLKDIDKNKTRPEIIYEIVQKLKEKFPKYIDMNTYIYKALSFGNGNIDPVQLTSKYTTLNGKIFTIDNKFISILIDPDYLNKKHSAYFREHICAVNNGYIEIYGACLSRREDFITVIYKDNTGKICGSDCLQYTPNGMYGTTIDGKVKLTQEDCETITYYLAANIMLDSNKYNI